MTIHRISYGGTDFSPEQRQAFLAELQARLPNAKLYSYPEADVDPEGAAASESKLWLWDVLYDVVPSLSDWLANEVASVIAEGFELDFLGADPISYQEARGFEFKMAQYRVRAAAVDPTIPADG